MLVTIVVVCSLAYALVILRLVRRTRNPVSVSEARRVFMRGEASPTRFTWKRELLVGVRSQTGCAACWSFVVAELMADQLATMSGGEWKQNLSAQYLLSCSTVHYGCSLGGSPEDAYELPQLTDAGVPLEKDMAYAKAVTSCPLLAADVTRVRTLRGTRRELCADPDVFPWFLKGWVVRQNVVCMKRAILEYGPIAGTLAITQDLYDFTGRDVFEARPGARVLGMHAIEIIGWDEYSWHIRNSYGVEWGDAGYARVALGRNESCIESRASVARVEFPSSLTLRPIELSAEFSFDDDADDASPA